MYTEFYKDRPLIQNEYEEADWNTASGLEPHVIDRMIRDFAAANPKMPAPLVMAHAYRLLLENAQLSAESAHHVSGQTAPRRRV